MIQDYFPYPNDPYGLFQGHKSDDRNNLTTPTDI